jgi:TrmH family RNA methyltransferase
VYNGVRLSGVIESPKNERIRRYRRLRKRNFRYREGLFLVEGIQSVAEALLSSHEPECVICTAKGLEAMEAYADVIRERSILCFSATDDVIASLTATVTPQGVVAVMPLIHVETDSIPGPSPSTILIANRVRDPGNLGNMIRIADAAGASGVVVCEESADIYNPKTVRSTAGSIFHLPICVGAKVGETLNLLKKEGYSVIATDVRNGRGVWEMEWPQKLALLMGNEAWGIPEEEEGLADEVVSVPVFGRAESLNVAAAAAVILYEVERRRERES